MHSVVDMIRRPGNIVSPRKVKKGSRQWVWTSLVNDHIKVNVDEFFLGGSGRGSIQGIFKDLKGRILV